jgi:hypothetical protein
VGKEKVSIEGEGEQIYSMYFVDMYENRIMNSVEFVVGVEGEGGGRMIKR